jgi:iron complex outermembrane recepter protein
MDLNEVVQWDTTIRYVDRLRNQMIPPYWALDFQLAYRLRPDLALSLSGRDLLDNRHPEFGQPVNRREIPRSIYAKITWYR